MIKKSVKCIIFDCDGVLVDSEIIANRIDAEMLSISDYPITTEECIRKFTGMNEQTVREMIFQETGLSFADNLFTKSTALILNAFETELQPLMIPFLEQECWHKLSKCVASSSPKNRVLRSLQITHQDHFFQESHIFTSSQVKRGKPFPDLFLLAAEKMGFEPKDCLVIEDSEAGIKAAQQAKMDVVGFVGGSHARFDWYQQRIINMNIPIIYNTKELIDYIDTNILSM